MTMLDRMRRHKAWLKWSLALVALALVIFYIPEFLRGSATDAAAGDTIASVEGHAITSGEFRRTYQAQLQAYKVKRYTCLPTAMTLTMVHRTIPLPRSKKPRRSLHPEQPCMSCPEHICNQ